MQRDRGEFAAKMWGIQFGVACMIMAAACAPIDAVGPANCLARASRTSASSNSVLDRIGNTGSDRNSMIFVAALKGRLGELSPTAANDVKSRFHAISAAIDDAARERGVSANEEQEHLRVQIVMLGDRFPDVPGLHQLVDSVQNMPGVLDRVTKLRKVIMRGRAWWASVHGEHVGASIYYANDTVAAVGTLMAISDVVADTGNSNWLSANLGDPVLADGLSSYSFDSTYSMGLTGSNAIVSGLRPLLYTVLYDFWWNGGSPEFAISGGCPGGGSPIGLPDGPMPQQCCRWLPDWVKHGVVGAVLGVIVGAAGRVVAGAATAAVVVTEDAAAGAAVEGLGAVVADAVMGFVVGVYGMLGVIALFDVIPDVRPPVHS